MRATARFCSECGTPISQAARSAEYKQVTVLFADVVHSMDIAAALGPERLREIMNGLADRCASVVRRYRGTVDKFTGDGIMAVFGAPVALEDHAVRACLSALGIQDETARLATEVKDRDGIERWLRVGLNSGQVIAGEIGSGPFGYTAVGAQVGFAQRMESVAPPGGVMLSESTAHLVGQVALLAGTELVTIKGKDDPVRGGSRLFVGFACALVELLIDRGHVDDLPEARRLIDQWRKERPGIPALDLWWLKSRALLAKAEGNSDGYVELAKQYLSLCEKVDAHGRLAEARQMVSSIIT